MGVAPCQKGLTMNIDFELLTETDLEQVAGGQRFYVVPLPPPNPIGEGDLPSPFPHDPYFPYSGQVQ